jgi:transposase
LAAEAGIEHPTDEDLRRFDKKRTQKKVSNDDWQSPTDEDSRIARMKDGRTHLAYKAEHVVDLKTDLVLAAVVYQAHRGDAQTLAESVVQAQLNIIEADSPANIREAAADKGYHSADTLALLNGPLGMRTYIPEPRRNTRWKWSQRPAEQQTAVKGNRRRVRGLRGKRLQRGRSELTERSFAHVCETGGARRCWLRGLAQVTKRYLLQVAARNLSLIMRKLFGVGTPRGLQSQRDASSLMDLIQILIATLWMMFWRAWNTLRSPAHLALELLRHPRRLTPAAWNS